MRHASVDLISLLFCGGLWLAAQTAVAPQQDRSSALAGVEGMNSSAITHPASPKADPRAWMPACPVNMQALQGTGRGLLVARDSTHENRMPQGQPSQRIHLILGYGNGKKIVQARVVAEGFGPKGQMQHTLTGPGDATIVSRTLIVKMHPRGADEVTGDLVLPGFTSVQTIRLLALRYDDGSSWNALLQPLCSVAPDPLMLVADR